MFRYIRIYEFLLWLLPQLRLSAELIKTLFGSPDWGCSVYRQKELCLLKLCFYRKQGKSNLYSLNLTLNFSQLARELGCLSSSCTF